MGVKKTYVAFLRGINVGGHHKVPMKNLREELEKINFKNCTTILNSGNVVFESDENHLENRISEHLEKTFGFPIPTLVRTREMIIGLLHLDPFKDVEVSKEIRLYVSFLKDDNSAQVNLPWISQDKAYRIIGKTNKTIFSVIDLSLANTPSAMAVLEKFYGKEITTRNWNTIERIGKY